METLRACFRIAIRIVIVVNVVLVTAVTLLLVSDVITRHAVGRSIPGAYDLTELGILLISCTALLWLDAERDHIGFSIIVDRFAPRTQVFVEVFWRICSIPLLAFMAYHGALRTLSSFRTNESRMGILEMPVWPARLALTVAFGLLALLTVFYIADAFINKRITSVLQHASEEDAAETTKGRESS